MKAIIVGGGKIGYYLTKTLLESNYDVGIIEINKEHSKILANSLDVPVIWGDATDDNVLVKAGVENSDTVIAVTGRDEVNLVVCQIAKKVHNVGKTIAKVNNPKNVEALGRLGVDIVVSGTDNIIRQLEREADFSSIKELLPLNGGKAAVLEITLPENYALAHKQICDIDLPESCNIISITRGDDFIVPRGKTKLMSCDKLLIVTATSGANEVKRALKLKK